MNIPKILKKKQEEILRICAKHGAYNVRIFGKNQLLKEAIFL